jgi:Mg2+ transporter MgtE
MFYLTQMLGKPVVDANGEEIGRISDVAIETGEIFPRVTSLAFVGPDKKPFMLSWRKYVDEIGEERVALNVGAKDIRFSYLQPDEVLLERDLLNKQIVDTQGKKVVRVNDLKLSEAKGHLRLLGAEVGMRGILRGISPSLERGVRAVTRSLGRELRERIIAWNYMDLLDRDLTQVKLSVTHKRLHELHPADIADILEELNPAQRAEVFTHLDVVQAAEAIAEMEDEYQAAVLEEFEHQQASDILEAMDPDDAADIISGLPYDQAERLLKLMGMREARLIRRLLGYREESAGGIMTSEIVAVTPDMTVSDVIEYLRHDAPTGEDVYYIYVLDADRTLTGVINLRHLITSPPGTPVADLTEHDVITVHVDDDQEDVAETITKYNLLAVPVVDESGVVQGVVTVDDALEVLEEESAEDLALATGSPRKLVAGAWSWLARSSGWVTVWLVLGVGTALLLRGFADPIAAALPIVFFLPLVVRMGEDASNHALGVLIEHGDPEDEPVPLRRIAIDAAVGFGLALVSALIVFGLLEAFGQPDAVALALAGALGLAVLAVSVVSALVPVIAIAVGGARRLPHTLVNTLVPVLGVAVYIAAAAWLDRIIEL